MKVAADPLFLRTLIFNVAATPAAGLAAVMVAVKCSSIIVIGDEVAVTVDLAVSLTVTVNEPAPLNLKLRAWWPLSLPDPAPVNV